MNETKNETRHEVTTDIAVTQYKTLQELTIRDNFMFCAVMQNSELCRELLEYILQIPIARVDVDTEKSIFYRPEYHGVRLDVYAKDEKGSVYDVEMQVMKSDLAYRSRYYHSQMDMDLLKTGLSYKKLPDSFVIFICDFDPLGYGNYCYHLQTSIREYPAHNYCDGSYTIFLSTKGTNRQEVPESLVNFLDYVGSATQESGMNSLEEEQEPDPFVRKIRHSVNAIKQNREMGGKYMLLTDLLQEESEKAMALGIEQGIKQGVEQGINSLILTMYRNSTSVEQIQKLTGLSAEAINNAISGQHM